VMNLQKYQRSKAVVDGIDSLITFMISFLSTLYLMLLLIYYFYVNSFSEFDVFLLVNILCMEEILNRVNKNIMEFKIKLKCLSRCE
jgi:hypothetical protein